MHVYVHTPARAHTLTLHFVYSSICGDLSCSQFLATVTTVPMNMVVEIVVFFEIHKFLILMKSNLPIVSFCCMCFCYLENHFLIQGHDLHLRFLLRVY